MVAVMAACGCDPRLTRAGAPPGVRFDTPADRRAAFAYAHDAYGRGDLQPALAVFETLASRYPDLADYHLYYSGVINAQLGHDADAEAAFNRLLAQYPQSVEVPAASLELGRLLVRDGRADMGRLWLQSALGAPDVGTEREARLALADADERAGNFSAAYAGFMEVRRAAPGSAVAQAAKERVLALRNAHPELTPQGQELLVEARLLVAERDYGGAKDAVEALPLQGASQVDPSDVLSVLASALAGLGQFERAVAVLRQLAETYPDSAAAPEALFRRASLLWNRDRDAEALPVFEEFTRRYPQQDRAAEAVYAIGRIHEHSGRSQAAIATYTELTHRYPHSKPAAEAGWRIGWIRYTAHNWSVAAKSFADLAARADSSSSNAATYWQARALERAGRGGAARRLYRALIARAPNDYYTMWAEHRLGTRTAVLIARAPATTLPDPAHGDLGPAPALDPFHLERWRELKAAGVKALARRELAAIERDHRHDEPTLTYLLRAYPTVDGYAAAIRLLDRVGRDAALSAAERERLSYPLAFWAMVQPHAQSQRLDPLLVEAIMRQESRFDPDAQSPANAHGLMQLVPATAEKAAEPADGVIDAARLAQPELNIRLGSRHLGTLVEQFHGDLLKAIAAYNGGEAAVAKWSRRDADLDPDEWVESISYRETRDYVKRVVSNYRTYQSLYGVS